MNAASQKVALRARYVVPVAAPPLHNACVVMRGEQIEAVTATPPADAEIVDLGSVAILPGLVNAHVHLEFSALEERLGEAGMPLPAWIREVLTWRQRVANDPDGAVSTQDALARGLAEAVRHGTTALGEIATVNWRRNGEIGGTGPSRGPLDLPLDVTVFRELIAPTSEPLRIAECMLTAGPHLAEGEVSKTWSAGLSPHAPYSAHPQLCEAVVRLHARSPFPVAIHLAESREELEWLAHGTGPLADLFDELELPSPFAASRRPLEVIEQLGGLSNTLFVHGNYLAPDEMAALAERASTTAVVYCPRTHAYFGHEPYPLVEMLNAGVSVALGTDGRGSNPDLSLLAEMRHVARQHPEVPLARILELGTLAGARALGREAKAGSLTPGKVANLAMIALPEGATDDAYDMLLRADTEVVATLVRGRPVFATDETPLAAWAKSD
ncbi:MAG: hypothetical protein DWQ31_15805 [Planctomycetota bacterium]|nr:MAG: hypothetical protein DWQ31_15805 [Planctomycetota bacterium]